MTKLSKILIITALVTIIALAFGGGFFFGQVRGPINATGLDVVNQAWNLITANYVDPTILNAENMSGAAIKGIVSTLHDRHTAYLTRAELEQFMNGLQGTYAGIGAYVSLQETKVVISGTMDNSPAAKAGLKEGDTILAVNGESIAGMSLDIAISKIRGPEGTTVTLLVLPKDATEPVTMELTRENLESASVKYELVGDIAHIYISSFSERTDNELEPVLEQVKADGAKGIVLDLRYNGGGWLDIVVKVASHFITDGTIVKVRSVDGSIEVTDAVATSITTNLPMVVLVNEGSASGSEVLAGALQDHQRALIAGNVTYGKGSVNTPFTLLDGSGLYLTIKRWLTPNDRLIEGQGITPDVMLKITGEEELQWAIDYLHSH